MCTLICRICLVDNVKMFYIQNNQLLEVYEKLTSAKLNTVNRPQSVCYICLSLLRRCCRFSEMALRSEQILTDMFYNGVVVTQQNIVTLLGNEISNKFDMTISRTQLMTVNGCDTIEASAVNVKEEPLHVKEENTLSSYILWDESAQCVEIANSPVNDSILTVLPNDVTLNNTSSEDEQFPEDSKLLNDIDGTASEHIQQSSCKKTNVKTNMNLYPCNYCTVTFSNEFNLMLHTKYAHNTQVKEKGSNIKQETHFVKKIESPVTKRTYTKQPEINMYPCEYCTLTFREKMNLISHKKLTHQKHSNKFIRKEKNTKDCNKCPKTLYNDIDGTVSEHIPQPEINMYPCEYCTLTFRKKMNLYSHQKFTHQKYSKRNKQHEKGNVKKHHPTTLFGCKKCLKTFSNNLDLRNHMETHSERRPFICEVCGISIPVLSRFLKHTRTHTGEKPYACPQCDRRFPVKCHLSSHIQRHNGEKPYTCEHCHKKFTLKAEVVIHMRTHTGEKPYACTQCDKTFSQSCNFSIHRRSHTGERPYACDQCDLRFTSKSGLVKHMPTHTTRERLYSCKQCNKRFYKGFDLNRHNKTHTGEKPFKCERCPRSFSQRSDLVIHVRTHTGEKPYSCAQCDRRFPTSSSLVKHKRSHAGEKL